MKHIKKTCARALRAALAVLAGVALIAGIVTAGGFAAVTDARAQARFGVLPIDDNTDRESIDSEGGAPVQHAVGAENKTYRRTVNTIRDALQAHLLAAGVKVMERDQLDRVIREARVQNVRGLIDGSQRLVGGALQGVTHLAGGNIEGLTRKRRSFLDGEVQRTFWTYTWVFNLKLTNAVRGEVLFIKNYRVSVDLGGRPSVAGYYDLENNSGLAPEKGEALDAHEEARHKLRDALRRRLRADEELSALLARLAKETEDGKPAVTGESAPVEFAPVPANCDVFVEGVFIGNTPLKRSYPVGSKLKIRFQKRGYISWQHTVGVAKEGTRVTPELDKGDDTLAGSGAGGIAGNGLAGSADDAIAGANLGAGSAGGIGDGPLSKPRLAALLLQSTVALLMDKGHGSGFVIAPGIVVTNRHVSRHLSEGKMRARAIGGKQEFRVKRVLAEAGELDLAVLEVPGLNLPPLRLGRSATLRVGQDVFLCGNPKNNEANEGNFSNGVISSLKFINDPVRPRVHYTIPANGGSSGGPVIDNFGRLVAIHCAGDHRVNLADKRQPIQDVGQGLNQGVPVDALRALLLEAGVKLQ